MSETELKKRLISRIQRSRNSALLREAYRLMGTDATDLEPYKLSKEQEASIAKGKKDINVLVDKTKSAKKRGKAGEVNSKETKAEAIARLMQETTARSGREIAAGLGQDWSEVREEMRGLIRKPRRIAESRKASARKSK